MVSVRRTVLGGTALVAVALGMAFAGAAKAGEFTLGAELMIDGRFFFQEPEWSEQNNVYFDPSVAAKPTAEYVFDSGNDVLRATLFGRFDPTDSGRTHFDVREGFYQHMGDGWDFLIGVNQVFWGVTEARHLVNIVNSVDFVEDVDQEDFLGQPMVNLSVFGEWGTLDLYAMPYFRKREFHAIDARFAFPLDVTGASDYESDLEAWHPDFAARYRVTVDNWDFGLSHFYGTSREPRFRFDLKNEYEGFPFAQDIDNVFLGQGSLNTINSLFDTFGVSQSEGYAFINQFVSLKPYYDIINQTGVEAVGVYDDLILKFEGATITGYPGDRIWATVAGFEYTFTDVSESGIDVGVLGEYLYDNREFGDAPYTPYDNDIFGGVRVTFNDVEDTNLLIGAVVDIDNGTTIFNLEASHRIQDNMSLSLVGRGFAWVPDDDPLSFYDNDSYLELRLSVFF